jgi:hypothetical protein
LTGRKLDRFFHKYFWCKAKNLLTNYQINDFAEKLIFFYWIICLCWNI